MIFSHYIYPLVATIIIEFIVLILLKENNKKVSFGIIYNKNKHHFVMFCEDFLYDISVSLNKSYNIIGYLNCCHKNPIDFMEESFRKKGSLIQYGEITDFNISCKDYFKNPTTLFSSETA